ncbi:MAG: hypothetical protein O3A88_00505, partial [Proteobacteria bacterium]|nr:hypothetical protein [Pseudomonadota bacterium]
MRARPPGIRRLGPALIMLGAAAICGPAFGQTVPSQTVQGQPGAERSGAAIYHGYCSYCHDDGTVGAPIVGDAEIWRERSRMGA